MKKLLLLIFFNLYIFAELPPYVYDNMKAESPEILKIKVLDVTNFFGKTSVKAKVLDVKRTINNIKDNDTIEIYYIREKVPIGIVGPSQPILVKEDKVYTAFLDCSKKKCSIMAQGKSFTTESYFGKILPPRKKSPLFE